MGQTTLKLPTPAIAPSILTADFGVLRDQIQQAEAAGVEMIHLDVMDGSFVPNISFGPLIVSAVRSMTRLPLDVHLMIVQPDRYVESFADAGADIITVHAEATVHPHRVVEQIHSTGADAGIAINPATSLVQVEELLPVIDLLLVMSVNPGFGGQSFIPQTVDKLQRSRESLRRRDLDNVRIEVDGGIKAVNIREAHDAGADIFVCGSSVYNDNASVASSVDALRDALA